MTKKKKVAILQSNYIPWKGYFDMIASVDVFVLFDDMQFTKNDWRNRNKIKTQQGIKWLTIPVHNKSLSQKISDTRVCNNNWHIKHWRTLCQSYSKAKYFHEIHDELKNIYTGEIPQLEYLSDINVIFLKYICRKLSINTRIIKSSEFSLDQGKSQRLLGVCKDLEATSYITAPAARCYLDEELFSAQGVEIEWIDYSGYPEYSQLFGEFVHKVSILDLIFNVGHNAKKYMKSLNKMP